MQNNESYNDPFVGKFISIELPQVISIAGLGTEYTNLRFKVLSYDPKTEQYRIELDTADENDGKVTYASKEFLNVITRRI